MSGAVSHGKNISWITRLTLGTRFYYWKKQLNEIFLNKDSEIISLINKSINTDIYNYAGLLYVKRVIDIILSVLMKYIFHFLFLTYYLLKTLMKFCF